MNRGPHISFRDAGAHVVEPEVDVVVVGSGAGGAAAAVTLARQGVSVAIVEAGPWRDPPDYPHSAYGGLRDLMEEWGAQTTIGRAFWPVAQARTMGGTTVVNSAICVRTPDDIFVQWQKEHGVSGLRERMLTHQERLEHELCVEEVPVGSRGRSNELAMKGAQALGWSEAHYMHRYVKGCAGSGQCISGCALMRKQSTNINFIPETRARGGVILSCAPVSRVLFEGRRAVGVTGHFVHPITKERGTRFTVRAKKAVIIAASATHSPVLLMRSGVKNPWLGHFFRAHPGTGVFGVYDDPVDQNNGATQGWASIAFRDDPGLKMETLSLPPEMVASRYSGGGPELMRRLKNYRHVAMWVLAVRAETVGRVSPAFMSHKPMVRYTLNERDMVKLRKGMVLLAKQHFAAGARSILPGVAGLPFELGPDQVSVIENAPLDPRAYVAVLSHLFGGCVMGPDEKTSVVDAHGRVHGYQNLLVADASVIPTNLGVNPQHTIMSLATVFAEDLLNR